MYMTRFPAVAFPLALLMTLITSTCWAHGTRCVRLDGALGVQAEYDNGEPIANADVSVFKPGNDETPWLNGMTDDKGRFFFVPDSEGSWTVRVQDAQGHSALNSFDVGPRPARLGKEDPARQKTLMLILGLAIIFGVFGIFSLLRRR